MRNEELMSDKREAEIAYLKDMIAKFKRYDEQRKAYYKEAMQRLAFLEDYVKEMERNGRVGFNAYLREENYRLQKIVNLKKSLDKLTTEEIKSEISRADLKMENKRLREENERLRAILQKK